MPLDAKAVVMPGQHQMQKYTLICSYINADFTLEQRYLVLRRYYFLHQFPSVYVQTR